MPQEDGTRTTDRAPAGGQFAEQLRRRAGRQSFQPLIGDLKCQIVGRHDIAVAEGEEQVDLGTPAAEAGQSRELRRGGVGVEGVQGVEGQCVALHRFGEMALARAVEEWDADARVELTTVERYLDQHPASAAGSIVEFTSWSCAHGVERWRSDCGCRMADTPGVDQRWRRPLRDLLDAVTDIAARLYAEHAGDDLRDPLEARHDYGVVLSARPADRERVRDQFLRKHRAAAGSVERCWAWMEAERLRLEAWSSCAWFFDTVDRIETQQVLAEARAALGRYAELTGSDARPWFDAQVALLTPA